MIHSLMMLSVGAKWGIIERKQRFRNGRMNGSGITSTYTSSGSVFDSGSFWWIALNRKLWRVGCCFQLRTQTHKHTRTKPITVPAIICQMMWTEHRRDQSEKQKARGCSAARSLEQSKTERDPPPTTGAQLITGCRQAFPVLVQTRRKITWLCIMI